MPFLVTGATGYVGRTIAAALGARGTVTALARRGTPSLDAASTGGITHDLTAPLPDLRALDGAVVIHCAAEIRASAWADHWRGNVIATRHVMDWAVRHRSPRVVLFSTGGVYGFQTGRRMSERDPVNPEGHYARTKLMAEDIARKIAARHGIDLVVLRLYFPFGGPFPFGAPGAGAAGLFQRVLTAVRDGGVLHVNPGGAPRITPVHVDDVAAAVLASVDPSFAPGTFNLSGDEDLSVLDLIERVQARMDRAAILRQTQHATGDLMGDNTSLRVAGWTPIRSVDGYLDGLEHRAYV
jgi:nucleoside-diphosphate-sugar epimerase